eukprot:s591_g3.t1
MASAQLYWGRMATSILRLVPYIFPDIDWVFVFVDDFCWILRAPKAVLSSTTVLATLLALGVPLRWKKTVLSEFNTCLGFVINPRTSLLRMGEDKHEIIMATLDKLQKREVFTSKAIEKALDSISWATTVCWNSDLEFPNKASVWWFLFQLNSKDFPWAFVEGDSTRRIAALEMLGIGPVHLWGGAIPSGVQSKKSPVPLLAPTYSFTGRDWWSPLMTAWQKMGTLERFQGVDKDYTGVLARPSAADRALRWLTWHSFRVFVPDCAYQLGFPRDQRQYLGNWTTETTADIYTRDKKNLVEKVRKAVGDKMGILKLDERNEARRIDLNHEDWDDPQVEMPLARALDLDPAGLDKDNAQPPEPKLKKRRSPLSAGRWEAVSEGRPLPPPLGIVRVVAASKKARGSQTFTVHLLTGPCDRLWVGTTSHESP